MVNAEPEPALMPGLPLDGVSEHLIYHRFAFAEMDSHLRSASDAAAVAKILRMTTPMDKRLGQEIAGPEQHCPEYGRFVFGIKPDAERRKAAEDLGAICRGRAARRAAAQEMDARRQVGNTQRGRLLRPPAVIESADVRRGFVDDMCVGDDCHCGGMSLEILEASSEPARDGDIVP